ncbi:MAG: hypothetical protein M1839_006604 [Geoglossum umbratile]|nr:MAG: hypothetical protein M1839_006604 [Geoglossum umbratile]
MAPPPPVTPSPHRFIVAPKQHQHQPSQPHDQTPVRRNPPPPPPSSSSSSSTARQFKPPPRFSSTPAKPTDEPDHHAAHAFSSPLVLAQGLKRKGEKEVIETSSASPSSDDNSSAEEENDEPAIRKRQRLSLPALGSHSLFDTPQTPTSPTLPPKTPHARFIFPHPPPPPPDDQNTTPITSLFHSLLIPHPSNPTLAPDPSLLLSPHSRKKGEPKYLPEGLAGEVRGWVVGASGARGKGRGEVVEKLRVLDVRGGSGPFLVLRGEKEDGGEEGGLNVLLINQHGAAAGGGLFAASNHPPPAVVRQGAVVALKSPVWDVSLRGEKWRVGVDWRIV